jgi:hypothetical protein
MFSSTREIKTKFRRYHLKATKPTESNEANTKQTTESVVDKRHRSAI